MTITPLPVLGGPMVARCDTHGHSPAASVRPSADVAALQLLQVVAALPGAAARRGGRCGCEDLGVGVT